MNHIVITPETPLSELKDKLGKYSVLNIDALGGVKYIAVLCCKATHEEIFITLHPDSHFSISAGLINVFCSRIDIQVKRWDDKTFLVFGCWEGDVLVGDFRTTFTDEVGE